MPTVSVLNADSGISGKTLITAEGAFSPSGLWTFSRAPSAPFAVQAGSANVPNLDASLLSGIAATGFQLTSTVFTDSSNANENDLNVGFTRSNLWLRCTNTTDKTITGVAGGQTNQLLLISSLGNGNVFLTQQDGASAAANRFNNLLQSGSTVLGANKGHALYSYDSTSGYWRLIFHLSGAVTWTPQIKFGGAQVGMSYSYQVGTWSVIGMDVFYHGRLTFTAKGGSAGVATVENLPYFSDSSVQSFGFLNVPYYQNMAGLLGGVGGYVIQNSTGVSMTQQGAAATSALSDANFTNTSDLVITGRYLGR